MSIKKVSSLRQGDKIFNIEEMQVRWYTYLCVHPSLQYYHILIDNCENPVRKYEVHLQDILNKNLRTYKKAKLALATELEEKANRLRTRYK